MAEGGDGGGTESTTTASKPMSSYESSGGRQRFTVELRPGETTIVSWKKLLRDTSKSNGPGPSASRPFQEAQPQTVPNPPPTLPTEANSKQPIESRAKDSETQAGTNRLATVIEKIERLYAGNSSEEEDVFLNGVPDDDEYDTEDSFIDDAELDDYFKVDNSAIKHDGFFVNRGKLERIEPIIPPNPQPKKRRRKDVTSGEGDDGHIRNKQVKIGNKGKKSSSSTERNSTTQLHKMAAPNIHKTDLISEASPIADLPLKKKSTDPPTTVDHSGRLHADGIKQDKEAGQQINPVPSSHNHNSKRKASNELSDSSGQRPNDRNLHVSKPHSGKQLNSADGDQTIRQIERSGLVEKFDLNVPASKDSPQTTKVPLVQKEGSNVRPKISMLEKAFRDLEKIVSECRPPSTEVRDSDNSSQGIIKRRLSTDIKQKMTKVARLSLDNYGKIPKDVINRLMGIVGHLMQIRSLRRNLRLMAGSGVTARREKDDRMQKIKQEVQELITQRIPSIKSKMEQQMTNSDDFQESGPEEREALQIKYSMDDTLENKLCELYNLYVERLEEFSGPPVKRLFEELVALWPSEAMDIAGIKRAIYKAKERKRALKDQEKIKKKVSAPRADDSVQAKAVNVNPSLHVNEKVPSEADSHVSPSIGKPMLSTSASQATSLTPALTNMDKQKQGVKVSSNPSDAAPAEAIPKKRVKKKINPELLKPGLDKPVDPQADERHKLHKNSVAALPKSILATDTAPSGVENPIDSTTKN